MIEEASTWLHNMMQDLCTHAHMHALSCRMSCVVVKIKSAPGGVLPSELLH